MTYELHNFIEDYPLQNDPDIQWNIACRKEFNEMISDKDKLEKVDRFFKHQQLFTRYLRQYDRIFNIQATGTGKSGSIINAAEFFKKNSNIKRVYVLQPGPTTKSDFKNQIKKLSDPDEYINDKIKYSLNKASYNNNMTRLIKEWYTIETYPEFTKKNYSDEVIKEEFSDCLFFMDEAHSITNGLDNGRGGVLNEQASKKVYDFLWRVCHIAERSKIVVGTATPMINTTFDFVPLLNLLLPMDFQLPENVKKDYYNLITLNQLEPFLRGKITFIKFSEVNINIINMGEVVNNYNHDIEVPKNKNLKKEIKPTIKKIENNKIIIVDEPKQENIESKIIKVPSQMSLVKIDMIGIQLKTYIKIITGKVKNFQTSELQTSVFVYPNGEYGTKGFNRYTYKDDLGEYQFKQKINDTTLGIYPSFITENDLEKSLKNLRFMSSKFHFFINRELEASKNKHPGNSFNYMEFVDASGATLLGMLLKIFGFSEYKNNYSPRDPVSKNIIIDKRKRFLLLTAQNKNFQESLNFFNSDENRHGEYIQILIGSGLTQVGINIKNVRRGYITTPIWHEAGMYQALSRFIRADSHLLLYKELGKKVDVEIYRLASTVPDDKNYIKSSDIKRYLHYSELKDINNKRILRFMKICAFDGFLNYDRNVNLYNVNDGDPEADYDVVNYKLWSAKNNNTKGMAMNQGPNPGDYIYNTYNLLYSNNIINKVKQLIKNIIKQDNIIDIEELKIKLNKKYTDYIFNTALGELIYNKEIIPNEQNTINYYLNNISNLIFLKRENIYSSLKISTENGLYLDNNYPLIEKLKELKGENKIKSLEDFYTNYENLSLEELKNLYIQEQDFLLFKTLLEDSLIRLKVNNLKNINKLILEMLSNYILIVNIPTGYIKATEEALIPSNKIKQGRKRSENSMIGFNNLNLEEHKRYLDNDDNNKVYVHFYKDTGKDNFAVNSLFVTKNKEIRILKDNSNEFVNANNVESYVYNYLFELEYNKIFSKFEKSKYYGTMIYRGIGDIIEQEQQFFRIIDNTDNKNRGKNCFNYNIQDLINIFKYMDSEGKYKKMFEKKIKKPKLCPLLIKIFEDKGLLFSSY
jgi:hypothetical protein